MGTGAISCEARQILIESEMPVSVPSVDIQRADEGWGGRGQMYMRGSKFHGPVSLRGCVSGSQRLSRERECGTEAADNLTPSQRAWPQSCLCPGPAGSPSASSEWLWPSDGMEIMTPPVWLSEHLVTALQPALQEEIQFGLHIGEFPLEVTRK